MKNNETGELVTTMYDGAGYENYRLTTTDDNITRLDVELTSIPEEYADMMNNMRLKALDLLQTLCEAR